MILTKPITTEKAIKLLETENKIAFLIDRRANKTQVKKEVEKAFKVKVDSIKTHILKNKKIAYVKLKAENPAIDIATKLGMI